MKENTEERMYKMLDFVKDFTAGNGYPPSVREICRGMDIKSTATVYYYLNMLQDNNLIRKAEFKNRALEVLSPYSDKSNKKTNTDVPLLGRIAAGEPLLAVQNIEDVYSLPREFFHTGGELFMLKVKGDSMIEAGIFDGDNIIVKKQETAENGEIVAALLDDSATVKRFYKEKDYIRLHPENPRLKDIISDNVTILGIVVGLIRSF